MPDRLAACGIEIALVLIAYAAWQVWDCIRMRRQDNEKLDMTPESQRLRATNEKWKAEHAQR